MAKKKEEVKRSLVFSFSSGKYDRKEIGKAVEVVITDPDKSFMFIEKMKDGKFRLTWSRDFLKEDISKLRGILMDREDGCICLKSCTDLCKGSCGCTHCYLEYQESLNQD